MEGLGGDCDGQDDDQDRGDPSPSLMTISCQEENCDVCDKDIDELPLYLNDYGERFDNCMVCGVERDVKLKGKTVKTFKEVCIKSIIPEVQILPGTLTKSYPFCKECTEAKVRKLTDTYRELQLILETFDNVRWSLVKGIIESYVKNREEGSNDKEQGKRSSHKRDVEHLFKYWKRYAGYPVTEEQSPNNEGRGSNRVSLPIPSSPDSSDNEVIVKQEPNELPEDPQFDVDQAEMLPVLHLEENEGNSQIQIPGMERRLEDKNSSFLMDESSSTLSSSLTESSSSDSDAGSISENPNNSNNNEVIPPTADSSSSKPKPTKERKKVKKLKKKRKRLNTGIPRSVINRFQEDPLPVVYTNEDRGSYYGSSRTTFKPHTSLGPYNRNITCKLMVSRDKMFKSQKLRMKIIQFRRQNSNSTDEAGRQKTHKNVRAMKAKRRAIREMVHESLRNNQMRLDLITSRHEHPKNAEDSMETSDFAYYSQSAFSSFVVSPHPHQVKVERMSSPTPSCYGDFASDPGSPAIASDSLGCGRSLRSSKKKAKAAKRKAKAAKKKPVPNLNPKRGKSKSKSKSRSTAKIKRKPTTRIPADVDTSSGDEHLDVDALRALNDCTPDILDEAHHSLQIPMIVIHPDEQQAAENHLTNMGRGGRKSRKTVQENNKADFSAEFSPSHFPPYEEYYEDSEDVQAVFTPTPGSGESQAKIKAARSSHNSTSKQKRKKHKEDSDYDGDSSDDFTVGKIVSTSSVRKARTRKNTQPKSRKKAGSNIPAQPKDTGISRSRVRKKKTEQIKKIKKENNVADLKEEEKEVDLSDPENVSYLSSLLSSTVRSVLSTVSPSPIRRSRSGRTVNEIIPGLSQGLNEENDDLDQDADFIDLTEKEADSDASYSSGSKRLSRAKERKPRVRKPRARKGTPKTGDEGEIPAQGNGEGGDGQTSQSESRSRSKSGSQKRKRVPQMCSICGKILSEPYKLKVHMRIHNNEKTHVCNFEGCGKPFSNSSQLKTHMRIHTQERPYQCEVCLCRFAVRGSLRAHKAARHKIFDSEAVYECSFCNERMLNGWLLKKHFRAHWRKLKNSPSAEGFVEAYRVHCQYCDIIFEEGEDFVEHQQSDEKHKEIRTQRLVEARKDIQEVEKGEKQFQDVSCPHCNEKLADERLLLLHINRYHVSKIKDPTGLARYPNATCEVCGKTFSSVWSLKTHMITHQDDKPFACDECGKKFNTKQTLLAHKERVHEEPGFFCQYCAKAFHKHRLLLKHLCVHHKDVHLKQKKFFCKSCYSTFAKEEELTVHVDNEHRDVTCMICYKVFGFKGELLKHLRLFHIPRTGGSDDEDAGPKKKRGRPRKDERREGPSPSSPTTSQESNSRPPPMPLLFPPFQVDSQFPPGRSNPYFQSQSPDEGPTSSLYVQPFPVITQHHMRQGYVEDLPLNFVMPPQGH